MTPSSTVQDQIGWLLENFRVRVDGLSHAVALSADGLVLATTSGLPGARAGQMGAVTSGLSALAHGAAQLFGYGSVMQVVVEMDVGFLLVTRVDDRACVAALAARNANLERLGYEVTLLVDRVGRVLAPAPRNAVQGNAAPRPAGTGRVTEPGRSTTGLGGALNNPLRPPPASR